MFCSANRIRLNDDWNRGPRRYRPNEYRGGYRDDGDRDRDRDRGQGKDGRGKGQRDQWQGKGSDRRVDDRRGKGQGKEDKPQPGRKDKPVEPQKEKKEKPAKPQEVKEVDKAASAPAAGATAATLRESVYWRYGPFPPNSRAARRTKNKVKLGSHGLKKLTQLDGKKWEKNGPIYQSSVEALASALSYVTSVERWRLRIVAPAFALAFQLDPAWTSATLEPSNSFQGPWILRDHLPTQLDVMHKHRDVLTSLSITGYDGLQGALFQNFTSLVSMYIRSSGGCTGLSCIPKSVKKLQLEFCTIKGEVSAQLEALKESHPDAEVVLVNCADDKKPEAGAEKAEKGNPFKINLRLVGGTIKEGN